MAGHAKLKARPTGLGDDKKSAYGLCFCLSPLGHVYNKAWLGMIKIYNTVNTINGRMVECQSNLKLTQYVSFQALKKFPAYVVIILN